MSRSARFLSIGVCTILTVALAGLAGCGDSSGSANAGTAAGQPAANTGLPSEYQFTKPRARASASNAKSGVEIGNRALDWTLMDRYGQHRKLSDHLGNVVVMDFWATWCAPCKAAMPHMQELHDQFADRGVWVYGVNAYERGIYQFAMGYVDNMGYTYPQLVEATDLARLYGARSIPTFVVIGVDGSVIFRGTGGQQTSKIGPIIEKHLAEHGL